MRKVAPLFPITGFVGPNGGGKSLAVTELMIAPAIKREIPILSNMHLNYEGATLLESWTQLTEFSGGIVVLDEITSVLPSREFRSLPAQLARVTNQLRKQRIRLGWTAPAWARADTMLREVTQGVYVCRGYFKDYSIRAPGVHRFPFSGAHVKAIDADAWPPNRFFVWKLYDAIELEEFTMGSAKQIGHKYRKLYWRPGHEAHALYDTEQGVGLLDHLDDTGTCVQCGGTRRRPACSCGKPEPKPTGKIKDYKPARRGEWGVRAS